MRGDTREEAPRPRGAFLGIAAAVPFLTYSSVEEPSSSLPSLSRASERPSVFLSSSLRVYTFEINFQKTSGEGLGMGGSMVARWL